MINAGIYEMGNFLFPVRRRIKFFMGNCLEFFPKQGL